jgi:hormone-sensitive lipase
MNKFSKFIKQGKSKMNTEIEGIIIHIHGGGFVSGSSGSHRTYLYRWAKSLNRIIFSIDYRLAPEYTYPACLDDCWQAYNWIINYSEPLLGIKTNKIILTGDSAGGNLAMALTLRAIKMGVRVPDGCMLSYPALNLFPKIFSPSYFLALEDMVLPSNMLKLVIKAYVSEEFDPKIDPFLSPLRASDELLAKLPPIRIVTGTKDPLHDDNWRFLQRMQGLNKDIKMLVYENMPHGFLQFDQIEEYKTVIEGTCKVLEELFYDQKEVNSPNVE